MTVEGSLTPISGGGSIPYSLGVVEERPALSLNTTTKLSASKCPQCGEELDAATAVENGKTPKEGDFSICLYCGQLMFFNADLTLRGMGVEEGKEFLADLAKRQPYDYKLVMRLIERARENTVFAQDEQ